MRECAHALKGSAGTLGAKTIVHLCREIELAISIASLHRVQSVLGNLRSEVPSVRQSIRMKIEETTYP